MFTKKVILTVITIFSFLAWPVLISADNEATEVKTNQPKPDKRIQVLRAYLAKFDSPLVEFAQDFIEAADIYNLDWKLVAAISGVESTFGKFIPGGTVSNFTSYNGWGWGVYGNQAIYFKSWKEGIYTVSKGLRENYFNKGYTNPFTINTIYAASPAWGSHVAFFLQDIEEFRKEFEKDKPKEIIIGQPNMETKVAGYSAAISP